MAESLKFVYIVILFVSLFISVVVCKRECVNHSDCYKLYPSVTTKMMCNNGHCECQMPT
ncbi:unnamed protein product [Trifolium pratense]|uniref:Uncharacterized protein n=1 Tax=Trifolium pratense TaxID=57577 RepID=A0ACB0LPY9_TRIPR|nr:unnamed protein product [Trifolium pratense]